MKIVRIARLAMDPAEAENVCCGLSANSVQPWYHDTKHIMPMFRKSIRTTSKCSRKYAMMIALPISPNIAN